MRMLYILDMNILLDILFTDVFSEVLACIFICFLKVFQREKLLIFMKPNLSTILFMDTAFGINS